MDKRAFLKKTRRVGLYGAVFIALDTALEPLARRFGKHVGLCDVPQTDIENPLDQATASINDVQIDVDELASIMESKPYLLLGKPDHADTRIDRYITNSDFLKAVKLSGKKHWAIELPVSNQERLDKITPDTREKYVGNESDLEYEVRRRFVGFLIENKANTVSVHAIDDYSGISAETRQLRTDYYRGLREFHSKMCGDSRATSRGSLVYSLSNIFDAPRILLGALDNRMDDTQRIDNFKERCGDDPAVIEFGSAHLETHQKSMKSLLGPENCVHINVYGDKKSIEPSSVDYNIDASTGRIYKNNLTQNRALSRRQAMGLSMNA